MAISLRRARATCSPELEAVARFLAVFSQDDLLLARALLDCRSRISDAALMLGVSPEAARQRLCTLTKRLKEFLPDYQLRRGPHPREISFDQYDRLGAAIGVTESRHMEGS